jgi:hypothetical protein
MSYAVMPMLAMIIASGACQIKATSELIVCAVSVLLSINFLTLVPSEAVNVPVLATSFKPFGATGVISFCAQSVA